MNYLTQKKEICIKLLEFIIVSALALFFLSKILFYLTSAMKSRPQVLDQWYMCYVLENQVTRILGLNPGGIWEGGLYYPFHTVSMLFDEPSWGISLLITPVWMFTKNIFPIFWLGGMFALFLSWIFTYYFVESLGSAKIWAFCAGAVFCLSGVTSLLLSQAYAFWAFFLVPLLGLITLKIFSTSRLYWGVLWGILFGYLAWSSAHIFIMGGLFLCLFVLWNLLFNNHSKKTLLTLLIAFILSGIIAGAVLVPMYFTQERFGFYRDYYNSYLFSSNWANLIYRIWPYAPFNPIAKTPLWEYFKTNAKGETNIGMSIFLLFNALIIVITRLKEPMPLRKANKYSKHIFIAVVIIFILFAFLNMHSLTARCMQLKIPLPKLAYGITYLCYAITGIIIYVLRHRIRLAIKHLDFFLLLSALLFGLLCFGPYYLTENKLVIASPVAFLQYYVPGFSGIHATARWGLMFSFAVSIAIAIFLSKYTTNRRLKICAVIFLLIALFELSPGFRIPEFKNLSPYRWTPRETDIFLKNIPDNGAVLELASYPFKQEPSIVSDNSLGYVLFSRLYHKKPLVIGYASYTPHVTIRYLLYPKDKTLSLETIHILRKFGAKYWVFHIDGWSLEEFQLFKDTIGGLKRIAKLDNGKTLIYEDPNPKASVGYYDVI